MTEFAEFHFSNSAPIYIGAWKIGKLAKRFAKPRQARFLLVNAPVVGRWQMVDGNLLLRAGARPKRAYAHKFRAIAHFLRAYARLL